MVSRPPAMIGFQYSILAGGRTTAYSGEKRRTVAGSSCFSCYPAAMRTLTLLLCGLLLATQIHPTEVFPEPTPPAALVKAGVLPDPTLSPGAIFTDITLEEIKQPNFDSTIRNVPESLKKKVFKTYGIDPATVKPGEYEIDHVVECALGGAQDAANLWPERYSGQLGAHTKDHLERVLLKLVRDGKVPLREAQHATADNWVEAYKKYVGPLPTDEDK